MITGYRNAKIEDAEVGKLILTAGDVAHEVSWASTLPVLGEWTWVWQTATQDGTISHWLFTQYTGAVMARRLAAKVEKVGPKMASAIIQITSQHPLPPMADSRDLQKRIPGIGPTKAAAVLKFWSDMSVKTNERVKTALAVVRAIGLEPTDQQREMVVGWAALHDDADQDTLNKMAIDACSPVR